MPAGGEAFVQTVHHKEDTALPFFRRYFSPIQVGCALTTLDLGLTRDDTGPNISAKNPSYCELTALYWAWKNVDAPYYGLMHYRRIFSARSRSFAHRWHMARQRVWEARERVQLHTRGYLWPAVRTVTTVPELEAECAALSRFLEEHLPTVDAILPAPVQCRHLTMEQQYASWCCRNDYLIMLDCIGELFPDMTGAAKQASADHRFRICNMGIMRKPVFEDYCGRLFGVLEEVERRIDLRWRNSYQQRVFGFLSERFFNIYLRHVSQANAIRTLDLPTVFVELR